MGDLQQNAGAVAGVFFTAARAPVIEILQHRERLLDDLVGLFTFDMNHEADAAGVVLETRIIQPLFRR